MPVALAPRASVGTRRNSMQGKAPQACASCRKQKRRCDKTMPACSLCTRMSRLCDYSDPPPTPSNSSIIELQAKIAQLETRLSLAEHKTATTDCLEVPKIDGSTVYPSPPSRFCSTPSSNSPENPSSRHSSVSPQPPLTLGYAQPMTPSPFLRRNDVHNSVTSGAYQNEFPTALFLDTRLFKNTGPCGPRITYDVPPGVIQLLGDPDSIQNTISLYFRSIHEWLPMVCKKYLHGGYWCQEADTAFLLLCMQLVTSHITPGGSAHTAPSPQLSVAYITAREFSMQLELSGTLSLKYLQGLILIALYEYGHGIVPAAWMTAGQCVRYADLLSLPSYKESNIILGPAASWGVAEERQRTWWAVYIVDKIVSVSYHNTDSTSSRRPLCVEPSPSDALPCDNVSWDSGYVERTSSASSSQNRNASVPYSEPQSPFARLCQTAMLTSHVLQHLRDAEFRRLSGLAFDYAAIQQLTAQAQELPAAMVNDYNLEQTGYLGLSTARLLNFSTMMILLNYYGLPAVDAKANNTPKATNTADEASLQSNSLESIKSTARHIHNSTADLMDCVSLDVDLSLAPVVMMDAIYRAGVAFNWMQLAESGLGDVTLNQSAQHATTGSDPMISSRFGLWEVRCWLGKLNRRWRLAGEFVKCLDQQGAAGTMPVVTTMPSTTTGHPGLMTEMGMIEIEMGTGFTGSI